MVKSKKLLSLFLAVVMVLSVFTVMASAYTRVETEGTVDIDVKYTVEKVATIPANETTGSEEYSADNIYAVTVWMKSAKAVDKLIVPFHYNKAHFAPITLVADGTTYPYGAGMDQDTWYTDMGEGTAYTYTTGDYMNNTGMYTATGATAANKALAKCIGLGNSNSTALNIIFELVSPDHSTYNKWGAGLPADTGVLYTQVKSSGAKAAYLNTISGITTSTDWNRMLTIYFETITDEDVTGDEFGVLTDDCFTVDGNYDANGKGYYESAAKYDAQVPSMNVVSNAVVEAAAEPSPVYNLTSQIRFNGPVDGDYAPFDVRTRAAMTAEDFAEICGADTDAVNNITKVGFVYADSSVGLTLDNAAKVIGGTAVAGYVDKEVEHIQKTATEYVWTCLIEDAVYADAVDSVGYIVVDGETYYFDAVYATDFSALYDTWSSKIPTA
ncbi:MAG: hypothetical protein E7528_03885 [Ruminococcaceae bacterium]|nr:hypothetical protein [Oscillospiraceae bacterium]